MSETKKADLKKSFKLYCQILLKVFEKLLSQVSQDKLKAKEAYTSSISKDNLIRSG